MKVLLIIILAIATQTNAFASMTPTEELKYVKQVAKEIRRDLWKQKKLELRKMILFYL